MNQKGRKGRYFEHCVTHIVYAAILVHAATLPDWHAGGVPFEYVPSVTHAPLLTGTGPPAARGPLRAGTCWLAGGHARGVLAVLWARGR